LRIVHRFVDFDVSAFRVEQFAPDFRSYLVVDLMAQQLQQSFLLLGTANK
jgi:hypothetical protein